MLDFQRFMAVVVSLTLIMSSAVPAYSTCGCDHAGAARDCCSGRQSNLGTDAPHDPEPAKSCCSTEDDVSPHQCSRIQIAGDSRSLQSPPCQQDQFFGDPIAASSTGPRVERTEDLPVLVAPSLVPELRSSEPRGRMHSRPPPGALASIPFFLLYGSFLS